MKGSMPPMNVEAKLREMSAAFDVPPGAIVRYPPWFAEMAGANHLVAFRDILKEAADELESRSRLAGRLMNRLAGDGYG